MFEIIKEFFLKQWGGMLGGLLTTAFVAFLSFLYREIQILNNEFSGEWIDAVLDENNNVIKVDIWSLKCLGSSHNVKGKVQRYYGIGTGRKWKCSGSVFDHTFYLIYNGIKEYSKHNGCVVAKIIDDPQHFKMEFKGNYIKLVDNNIKCVPINFYKLSKEDLSYIKKSGVLSFVQNKVDVWKFEQK